MAILYYHYALSVRRRRYWISLEFYNTYQIIAQTNYLMIGIALVKNSAKPTIFGTGDSDEPLKK